MNKLFDKIVESKWFVKISAFVLALLMFANIYNPNVETKDVNVPGNTETVVVEDVPITAYYDTENVVITGIPKTVSVKLTGPTIHAQAARLNKGFEVYIDLANAELGTITVPLEIKDLSNKLKATINPKVIEVTVKEKVTKEFKVEAEFNKNAIQSDYTAGKAEIKPKTVKITGAKDVIDKISYVKANVELGGTTNKAISQQAVVSAFDNSLNKLNVQVEPETVEVNIPVKRTSKTVPINIVEKGTPPSNVTIDSITLDKQEATISGPEDLLKDIDSTRVEIDVSKIEKNETLSLPVIIANGVTEVDPELVTATVKVTIAKENLEEETTGENESEETAATEKIGTKTVKNIPINIQGLANNLEASIINPENGSTSLQVTGEANKLNGLTVSDFSLSLDLHGMSAGEHEVQIVVSGPQDTTWELSKETASVLITNKGV